MRTRQLGAEALPLMPQPRDGDPPEVARALSEAYTLWSRGRRTEALSALRTAILKATELSDDRRALEVASEVQRFMAAVHGAPPAEAAPQSSSLAPALKPPWPPPRGRAPKSAPPGPAVANRAPTALRSIPAQQTGKSVATARVGEQHRPVPARTPVAARPALRGDSPTLQHEVDDEWEAAEAAVPVAAAAASRAVEPATASSSAGATLSPAAEPVEAEAPKEPAVRSRAIELQDLEQIEALADVPDDAKTKLLAQARVGTLGRDERVRAPHMLIVLEGQVEVGVPGRDIPVSLVPEKAARILASGSGPSSTLMISASAGSARYLALDEGAVRDLRAAAPWAMDELEADREMLHAVAGAVAGRLGARIAPAVLDELRVASEVRRLSAANLVIRSGERVRALIVVCAGSLLKDDGDAVVGGEVLFPRETMEAKPAPSTVHVGERGAVLLVARRPATKALVTKDAIQALLRGMAEA